MRKKIILIAILFLALALYAASYFAPPMRQLNRWEVSTQSNVSWTPFTWSGQTISGRYIKNAAMFIPARLRGLDNVVSFQFDLGSDLSMIYERNFNSAVDASDNSPLSIQRTESILQFWKRRKSVRGVSLTMTDINVKAQDVFVQRNYGQKINIRSPLDTVPIGTIGAEMFRDRILIIDYPGKRIGISDSIPDAMKPGMVPIELDPYGRIVLPMIHKGRTYRVGFDTGSSLFQLITLAKNTPMFTSEKDVDSLEIYSWGKAHVVTGKPMRDTVLLAGKKFSDIIVYSNHTGFGIDDQTDALTGNELFLDNVIVIDFKGKRFGVF